jgi:type IV pilus assembly protein PilW
VQDRLARLQENARFAMQFLIKDLRLAGYYGCVDEINSETVHNTVNSSSFAFNLTTPIEGLSNVSGSVSAPTGTWYPSTDTTVPSKIKLGTDAVAIRMQDTSSVQVRDECRTSMKSRLALLRASPMTSSHIRSNRLMCSRSRQQAAAH